MVPNQMGKKNNSSCRGMLPVIIALFCSGVLAINILHIT